MSMIRSVLVFIMLSCGLGTLVGWIHYISDDRVYRSPSGPPSTNPNSMTLAAGCRLCVDARSLESLRQQSDLTEAIIPPGFPPTRAVWTEISPTRLAYPRR